MKKILLIVIAVIILGLSLFIFLKFRGGAEAQMAVLKVTSTPEATIFLDNQNIGKTPFEQKVKAGSFTLKLIPETTVASLVSWEGNVTLSPNLLTFVNRDLSDSELTSGGEILVLEKVSGKKAELSVLSTPDAATVSVNGQEKSVTPLSLSDMEPGSYDITVATQGYKSRTIKVKTTAGYKLTAQFQMAVGGEVIPSPAPSPSVEPSAKASPKASPKTSPSPTPRASVEASSSASPKPKTSPPPKPYIEVQDTPTGFLNVRKEPSTSGELLKQVHPGEFYPLLDENDSGWFKIEYEADKEGWVSGQYAKKFE